MSTAFPNCFWLLPEIKEYHCATNPPVIVKFRMVRSLLSHQTPESSRNWGKAVYFYDVWTKELGHLFFILFSGGWGDMSLFYYLSQTNNLVFPYRTAWIDWTNQIIRKHRTASWWKFLPKIFQMSDYYDNINTHIFIFYFCRYRSIPNGLDLWRLHPSFLYCWGYYLSVFCQPILLLRSPHLTGPPGTIITAVTLSDVLRSLRSLGEWKQACHHMA